MPEAPQREFSLESPKSIPKKEESLQTRIKKGEPLANRMRPANLEEILGQEHLISEGKLLRRAIEADRIGSILLYGPPGCHAKGTKIMLASGLTKPVEEIQVGDLLMGPDSLPRKVLELAQGKEPMVEVSPKHGPKFIVNLGHILSLKFSGSNNSFHHNTPINIPIRELILTTKVVQERLKLWRTEIIFPHQKVPFHPYAFGYWLGNGSKDDSEVTIRDSHKSILEFWNKLTEKEGCHLKSYRRGISRCQTHKYSTAKGKPNPILNKIRETGAAKEKHIPDIYKFNSQVIRLQILAGLIDSDGYINNGGGYGITLKSKRLAKDCVFLARSLGISTSINPKTGTWNYKNVKKTGNYWRVHFGLSNEIAEKLRKHLKEKKAPAPKRNKDPQKTGFTIKHLPEDNFYGFSLNGDHLYLTEDFVVHHNTGKTSLARVIATHTQTNFEELNATESSVADLRKIATEAKARLQNTETQRTTLFIDEIHRFNKSQQDALLPHVERGVLRLIGATTQNPFFYVNGPLISRSQVFELKPLSHEDIQTALHRALQDKERGLGYLDINLEPEAEELLCKRCDGDVRRALNGLELAALTTTPEPHGKITIGAREIEESIQKKSILYDQDGDAHYDTISAFIKSMRGSDPNATLYWMAKMLEAGEEPRYIARRIVVHAAEDVGLADPSCLQTAIAAQTAVETIGMPECKIPLAMAALHVALAPKSNSSCAGISAAISSVQEEALKPIPKPLRDAHYPGAAKLGNGTDYDYPHNYVSGWTPQNYLPGHIEGENPFYTPGNKGVEKELNERLELIKAIPPRKKS